MSVVEEQRRQIALMQKRYAGRPKDELAELLLLALEREEVVAVAFRESLIQQRLGMMTIPHELVELIRHALIWIWKDEEMHSLYVRGAILKLGSRWLQMQAYGRQFAGCIGGWSTSIQQHLGWTQAPLSRLLAGFIITSGRIMGQIPREILPHLQHNPFRHFCVFNSEVEQAASMTWQKIAEVIEGQNAPAEVVHDIKRITLDEDHHAHIFAAFADALTEDDHAVPTLDVHRLAERIGEAGEYFLPRRLRRETVLGNPVGTGGVVVCREGKHAKEKRQLFRQTLLEAGLIEQLHTRARQLGKSLADMQVLIKANFMFGYNRRDPSCLVDPELLDELALFLREQGCRDIVVGETPNLYDHFFLQRSVREVAEYFGIQSPNYRLEDLSSEGLAHVYARGYGQYEISRLWKHADFRITFGKLASHPVEMVGLSMKAMLGVGGRSDQYLFSERQASYATALVMLCDAFPPHFAIVDGYDHAPDGMMGFVACPRAPAARRFYAGVDTLAVDLVVLRHVGLPVSLSSILQTAVHWFGDPRPHTKLVGTKERLYGWRTPVRDDWSTLLSLMSYSVFSMWSGRGSLFVPEMDTKAFPPKEEVSLWTTMGREFTRWVTGIRMRQRGVRR